MAESPTRGRLDQPRETHGRRMRIPRMDPEAFGRGSEAFARFMGTPQFLIYMTVFCAVWLSWNTLAPETVQFDPRSLNFTLLTLILSLQASYAAPLILLAQNRQDDRDRVGLEQDRARDERNLADTEYLTREVAALRIALRDVATRDFVRSELRDLLEEMAESRVADEEDDAEERERRPRKKKKGKRQQPPIEDPLPVAGEDAVSEGLGAIEATRAPDEGPAG
ncbi:DUF1003 domain-containing protein [Mobilicoccus massiliensis]|uniref:DUF1003 domain-containing protein n=1 Tax=Mobilicoccus massiliensis TaxID=1522310 RepID=UPI0009E24151|nr:DUF1003 domain-containing protein [Mobilicoccus massiliensis]